MKSKEIKKGVKQLGTSPKRARGFDLKKWTEEKQKFNEKMEIETKKGSFSNRVKYLMNDDFGDNCNTMEWIDVILQVADERKL